MIRKILYFIALAFTVACQQKSTVEEVRSTNRLITAGGTISEIVYELGFGDQIIATDITSTYPKSLQELPSIGYRNQIKAEGIFALGPDEILIEEGYLTEDVLTQLKASGLPVNVFQKPADLTESKELIRKLGKHFGKEDRAEELMAALEADLEQLDRNRTDQNPSAIFVMARGPETVFLAGEETFASELFQMSGLNSVATGFKDYIPLTPEALIKYDPDHIVFFESGFQLLGGIEGIRKINGIQQTKAFKNNNIHAFDGLYLSGFGPRLGKAALDLQAIKK
jgi:iron complex transport system substrate-binding protein